MSRTGHGLRSRFSDASLEAKTKSSFISRFDPKTVTPGIVTPEERRNSTDTIKQRPSLSLADELDYVDIRLPPPDKASRILGIQHRSSMEPIPASARNSIVSTRSARPAPKDTGFTPTSPLTSLYVVSGLPKSPHTWTLADPDSVLGLHHSDGAVSRFWRPEVLGSTVSPGGGRGRPLQARGRQDALKGPQVEVIASTLQPASTIHTFQFTLPAPNTPLAPTPSGDLLRASVLSADNRSSAAPSYAYPYTDDPFVRPSSAYLGPPSVLGHGQPTAPRGQTEAAPSTVAYHGVCLTVWSHADAERSNAIRRTLEAGRSRKESAQSVVASRIKSLRADAADPNDPTVLARRHAKKGARGPWTDAETDGETDGGGASESEFEVSSAVGHGPGESTLFLPGDTSLVSRHPVYDLMRDYLTLSWARFSKDVQSHTLQISKILAHPAPRAGDLIKLDASPQNDGGELEVIARFPGGLDFGRGLVDINFTMWPLFKCLNIDNILTICEIALAPTGRVIFFSRHPAMLGIAVSTIKYLVELRGWNGLAQPAVHSRDAKIYVEDPGPWIMAVRPAPEVCVCDLSCPSPPPGAVSVKQQREKYRQKLLAAFDSHYHPDHIRSQFKEAFPAGRFRPVCKIQAKRGASSAAVAEQIKPPEWWHSTRIIQAFDQVLQDKAKKPSFSSALARLARRSVRLSSLPRNSSSSTRFASARRRLWMRGTIWRRRSGVCRSDLWRDKFVTFEQYAEKLSAEATQLRTKINKEQRETKRLSGLVTLTAAEKSRLQNRIELERMRETMERMEQERAEMVAEVEAQIERALASMARPGSRATSRSRRTSDATKRPLRSFGTESTLAESYEAADLDMEHVKKLDRETDTIPEGEEEDLPASPNRKKRFSASETDMPQDGMNAVDEGISQKSDRIAQKVLQIQQKLENALAADRRTTTKKKQVVGQDSEDDVASETTSAHASVRGSAQSSQTNTTSLQDETPTYPRTVLIKAAESDVQTPRTSLSDPPRDDQSTPEPTTKPPTPVAAVKPSTTVPATSSPPSAATAVTKASVAATALSTNAPTGPALTPTPSASPWSFQILGQCLALLAHVAVRRSGPRMTRTLISRAHTVRRTPAEEDEPMLSPLPSEDFGVFTQTAPRDRVFSTMTITPAAGTPTGPTFTDDKLLTAKQ
ncbi:hypothetical protein B0H16DRAFT_1489998 [Mycena metata]|uniref:cDENN domain-containing protein n=1 Tax=Mycena metata TaxID=1033252 RepID=A0AAD7KIB3_9AGAR|nr:hypothetical protein B0H16DRAFT_1489998 [Mycena metata]